MYQRVTFYADDNSKRKLDCYFQSKKAFDKFLDIINKAAHTIMTYDLVEKVSQEWACGYGMVVKAQGKKDRRNGVITGVILFTLDI